MKDNLLLYQAQIKTPDHTEAALEQAARSAERAAALGADIVALPEMFCCPYETACFPRYAQPEGGPAWRRCSEIARQYGVWLSAGTMPELGADGGVYNTAYVFDREGRQAAKHRKMHLFDIDVAGGQRFRESETLRPGDQVTVFGTEFGPVGLCVCYDFRFPELGRLMALRGARLILVPAAFNETTGPAHWELMFRSQAMFNQIFAAGTAPALDPGASYRSWGHSIVADPWGSVAAQLDRGEGYLLTALDLGRVAAIRAQLPLTRHRRTDVYTLAER